MRYTGLLYGRLVGETYFPICHTDEVDKYMPSEEERAKNKTITGYETPAEFHAYQDGMDAEERVIVKFIEDWDGETNSELGKILMEKFKTLKKADL